MLLDLMPVVFTLALLVCVTARAYLSSLVVPAALWALYVANDIKLHELGSPVLPGDFILLANLGMRGVALLLRYLRDDGGWTASIVIALVLLVGLAWKERPLDALRGWKSSRAGCRFAAR